MTVRRFIRQTISSGRLLRHRPCRSVCIRPRARPAREPVRCCRRPRSPPPRGRRRAGAPRKTWPGRRYRRTSSTPSTATALVLALDLAQLARRRHRGSGRRRRRPSGPEGGRAPESPRPARRRARARSNRCRAPRGRARRRGLRRAAPRALRRGGLPARAARCVYVGPSSTPSAAAADDAASTATPTVVGSSELRHTCARATPKAGGSQRTRSVTVSGWKRPPSEKPLIITSGPSTSSSTSRTPLRECSKASAIAASRPSGPATYASPRWPCRSIGLRTQG